MKMLSITASKVSQPASTIHTIDLLDMLKFFVNTMVKYMECIAVWKHGILDLMCWMHQSRCKSKSRWIIWLKEKRSDWIEFCNIRSLTFSIDPSCSLVPRPPQLFVLRFAFTRYPACIIIQFESHGTIYWSITLSQPFWTWWSHESISRFSANGMA